MISDAFATVVLARIPYSDLTQTKKRPAVIVSSKRFFDCYGDVLLIGITSHKKDYLPTQQLQMNDWQQAGLPKPSYFKPSLFYSYA